MPARKPSEAASPDTADEAQATPAPVDAEIVDTPPEEKLPSTLSQFQTTFAAMKKGLRAELAPKFSKIEGELADLMALYESIPKDPSAQAVTDEEDYFGDKLAELQSQVTALMENRVTPVAFQELSDHVGELLTQERQRITVGEDAQGLRYSGPVASLADAPKSGKHILKAIHQVMKAVTFVPKSGQYNGGGARYSFRKFDDTSAALGAEFRTYGIFVQKRVISRQRESYMAVNQHGKEQRWTETVVEVEFLFTSLVDGTTLKVESYGEGKDNSDKSTAKAETMAMKTALTQAFMIPTDEPDPDQSRPGDDGDYSPPVGGGQNDQPPPPSEPEYTPQQLAMGAWRAASKPGVTRALLTSIWQEATERGLMTVSIQPHPQHDAAPLGTFLTTIGQTIAAADASPPAE